MIKRGNRVAHKVCENIFINSAEIRENLAHIGKKVQLATETILGTFDVMNCDSQRSLFVPSNRKNNIDIDSSDFDEDSYYGQNWDVSSIKSPESTPLLASIEFCDNATISNADRTTPCAVADIELLEENNNDPNNNLDSIQSYQDQENQISVVPHETQTAQVAEYESNPLPGCIKDFDEREFQNYDTKLHEEAIKILNLLPQFEYERIFQALCKNFFAENRALLALWDLIPSNRPKPLLHHVPKKAIRICNTGNAFKNKKVIFDNVEQPKEDFNYNKNQKNAAVAMQDIIVSPLQHENEDIVILNDDNGKGYSLNTENPMDIRNFKNTGAIPKRKNDIVSTQNSTVPRIQNGILHPAKLILNKKISGVKETYEKKYDGNECENKKLLVGRNTFERNSRNNKLNKYMAYLEYVKDIKESSLNNRKSDIVFRNVNLPIKNSIRQFFLHSKYKNSNPNILEFIKKHNKSKVLNISNTNSYENKKTKDKKEIDALLKYNSKDLQDSCGNTSISGSTECLDLSFGNGPTVASCKNSKAVSFCSTPKHLSIDTVDTVDATSDTKNVENPILSTLIPLNQIPTDSSATSLVTSDNDEECNESFSPTAYTQYYDSDPNNKNILNNSNMPNSSTPAEQTSGDEERKDFIQEEIVLPRNLENIYNNLLCIFPSIEEHYIKKLCFEHSEKDDEILEDLVDYILQNKGKWPIKKKSKFACEEQASIINKHVDNLSSIFPKADIAYLKKIVELRDGKENAIAEYIKTQCKNPTYVTKEENVKRMRITKYRKQYIHNFNERMFLEIFPDPFQHFENINRQCKYNDDAFNFLKSKFNNVPVDQLKIYYAKYKYNLSLTAQALETDYPQTQPITVEHNISLQHHVDIIHDIPLLQECAFVMHKAQITECMNKIKYEEIREFEKLKQNKELLECECCYDNECMPSKCFTCNDGHIFCNSCIINGVEVKLAQGNVHIKCFLDCNEEFSSSTLQKALSPTQFSIFLSKKQETEIMTAKLEGLVGCPFCSFVSIPPPEDKVFRCLNPECMKESCRLCKKLDHIPLKCREIEENTKKSKARMLLEEKMTEALLRKCYNCTRPYFKETGCNRITCLCGAQMCYICDTAISGPEHFTRLGCPYFSDNNELNTQTVNAVAEKTLQYITQKDIHIDASPILSANARTGVTNAEISRRVNKVAMFDDKNSPL